MVSYSTVSGRAQRLVSYSTDTGQLQHRDWSATAQTLVSYITETGQLQHRDWSGRAQRLVSYSTETGQLHHRDWSATAQGLVSYSTETGQLHHRVGSVREISAVCCGSKQCVSTHYGWVSAQFQHTLRLCQYPFRQPIKLTLLSTHCRCASTFLQAQHC